MASRIRINLTNASSRFIESFFSVSNEKVDGGEAVQKKRKEADLDGEVENEMEKLHEEPQAVKFLSRNLIS